MKILFLSHSFSPAIGGIETLSEFLAYTFHNEGYEVHLLTWTKEEGEKSFPFPIIRDPNILDLVKEHLWSDLIFENNPSVRLGWPALILGRPRIITLHTWVARINGEIAWQDRFKSLWLGQAKKVLSVSNSLRKHSWPKAIVIENPYDEETFKLLPDISRTSDFVFLGRLVSNKGANLAIQVLHQLVYKNNYEQKTSNKLTLTIIGTGPERVNLENLVLELKLQDRVQFKGALSGKRLVEELNKHKYLLVPSLWKEPFGIVVLEGMACGCVPIASNGGGLPEAVGDAGVTFERGNIISFITVTKKLLESPALVQKLKANIPAHLAAHHSKIIAAKYLNIIKAVLASEIKK